MKIAFVGKGGSGKSSLSWLAGEVLRSQGKRVLMIDADHNMDLAYNLGVTVSQSTPTLHRAHTAFLAAVEQPAAARWSDIVLDGRPLPTFTLHPKDEFTKLVALPISESSDLIIVGLGATDILFSGKCAHGHSAPLKFYLPLLQLQDDEAVVIDGVAGVDMMNFGLFNGADAIVTIVENHPNSLRVAHEVSRIASHSNIPVFALLNKMSSIELPHALPLTVIGTIPHDDSVRHCDSSNLAPSTTTAMAEALAALQAQLTPNRGLARVQAFETARLRTHA